MRGSARVDKGPDPTDGLGMRVVVDLPRCQGYAQCAFAAPGVFKMRFADSLQYDPNPDDAQREQVLEAAAACPVQAIHVAESGTLKAPQGGVSPRPAARKATARRDDVTAAFKRGGRVVIVGASLAGMVAASALRREGFGGPLVLIGDEPHET